MSRDPRVEQLLRADPDLRWEYRTDVPIKSIHRNPTSSTFQARLTTVPLNADTVELYANALANGAEFPAPALASRGDGSYDILGGFHRVNAMVRAARQSTDAYVLKADAKTCDLLARTLNNLEAVQGASRGERVAQAKQLIARHGYTARAAAKTVGISESTMEQELRAAQCVERLAGEINPAALSTGHFAEMQSIQNDNVLRALAPVIAKAKLPVAEMRPILAELRGSRTEQGQLDLVRSFAQTPLVRERLSLAKAGRLKPFTHRRRSSRLFGALTSTHSALLAYPSPAEMGLTADDLALLRSTWTKLTQTMEAFLARPSFTSATAEPSVAPVAASAAR